MTTYVWVVNTGSGNWNVRNNWNPNRGMPNSTTAIASFTTPSLGDQFVSLTGGGMRTINQIIISNIGYNINYSGSTLVFGGINAKLMSTSLSNVVFDTPLIINTATEFNIATNCVITVNGAVSGNFNITVTGGGKLILTNVNNTYRATTISSGSTVQLGVGTSLGTFGSLNVTTSGTVAFNTATVNATNNNNYVVSSSCVFNNMTSNSQILSGVISGSGTMNISSSGIGALITTSSNTFNGTLQINTGSFQCGNVGTSGDINNVTNIVNNGSLIISRTNNISITCIISGTGSLSNISSGSLILTGVSTYSGPTTISAGTLIVNSPGSIINSITTASNCTIKGTNSNYGEIILNTGAILKSGNSIGITNVTGNLTFNSGSTFTWEIDGNTNANVDYGIRYDGVNVSGRLIISNVAPIPKLAVILINPSIDLANVFWDTGNVLIKRIWNVIRTTGSGTNTNVLAATNAGGSVSYTGGGIPYNPAYGYFSSQRATNGVMNNGLQIVWNWLSSTCIHEDMNIITNNGIKKIKELTKKDLLLANNDKYIEIYDIVLNLHKHTRFIKCDKNCFDNNVPNEDLLLTSGHKILFNGDVIKIKSLINNTTIKKIKKTSNTYSIVTQNGDFVMINNVPVATWNIDDWKKKLMDHM